VPIADWLKGPLLQWATTEVNDPEKFENVPLVQDSLRELLKIHGSGKRRAHPLLWAGLIFLDFAGRLPTAREEFVPGRLQRGA
jgi:hypothetical protein